MVSRTRHQCGLHTFGFFECANTQSREPLSCMCERFLPLAPLSLPLRNMFLPFSCSKVPSGERSLRASLTFFASWAPSGERFQLSGSQSLLCSAPCDPPIHLWSRRWCRLKQLSKKWQLGVAKVEATRHTAVMPLQSCALVEYWRQPCICTGGGDQRGIRVSSLSLGVVRNNTHTSYTHDERREGQR